MQVVGKDENSFEDSCSFSDECSHENKKEVGTYAISRDSLGLLSIPGKKSDEFECVETIKNLRHIDWGTNHCVFIDDCNRIFIMG